MPLQVKKNVALSKRSYRACRTQDIVFGKYLAIFGVTLATLAANVISIFLTILVSLKYFPDGSADYYLQNIGLGALITLLSFIGLASVASAMSLAVTTASKSMKEAQKYTDSCHSTYQCTCGCITYSRNQC